MPNEIIDGWDEEEIFGFHLSDLILLYCSKDLNKFSPPNCAAEKNLQSKFSPGLREAQCAALFGASSVGYG